MRFFKRQLISFLITFPIVSSCTKSNADQKMKLPEVEVTKLTHRKVTLSREYICEISAVHYVEIRARVLGYLEDIYIDEGHPVKKGQPLFRISSNDYKESVTKAEANLQRMISESKTKKLNVERIKLMVDKKVISATELEVARAQLEAAQFGVREAVSVLENAKINLSYTFIRAPFDGIVNLIPFKRGSLINSGTILTSVSNIDEVFAYFKVSEAEYLKLAHAELKNDRFSKEQQKVSMILADGSLYNLPGHIETMEGDFDRQTGSISIRARFPNPAKLLKNGSSGKILMNMVLASAILIPQESIFSIQDKNYVFVVDRQNITHAKNFTTLGRTGEYFITDGLNVGDRIAVDHIMQLKDGIRIKPKALRPDSSRLSKLQG